MLGNDLVGVDVMCQGVVGAKPIGPEDLSSYHKRASWLPKVLEVFLF